MANDNLLMDAESLDENADLGLEYLGELIDAYLNQATEVVAELHGAIRDHRPKDLSDMAHRLAGSSAACGASAVMTTLRKLEQCGREENLEPADALLDQVIAQLQTTQQFLEGYVHQKGASFRASFTPPTGVSFATTTNDRRAKGFKSE
ncbi:MAG: Hpt domain-containing protein [Thermoguttaceae bacterium]